jgi:hypothetical protein
MGEAPSIPLRVECYSGYRSEERPVAFWFRDRRVEIQVILDRWYGEDHAYFKVVGEDGIRYIMRRDDYRGGWELILMEVPGAPVMEARH